jgi:hypothetical protein
VDNEFLSEEFRRFGKIEEVKVFYHGRKHLKMGSILYYDPTAARRAFRTMNNNTLFGVKISLQLDSNGDIARSALLRATSIDAHKNTPPVSNTVQRDIRPPPPPLQIAKPPPPAQVRVL